MRLPVVNTLISPHLTDAIAEMREQLAKTSKEAVTGRYSDLTGHLQGSIGKAYLSEKAVRDIEFQRAQLNLREGRLDVVQRSLTLIQDATGTLDTRLQSALGFGNQTDVGLAARDAVAALEQVFTSLNVRHGERYLFSGDATSTRPFSSVDDLLAEIRTIADTAVDAADFATNLDAYFNDPAGPWQQGIYSGTATASDPDAIPGIHPSITELVSGLATLALAQNGQTPTLLQQDSSILYSAANSIANGKTSLTNLRADRGVIQEQIARAKTSLDTEETIFMQSFNNLTGRDQYQAAAELKELEGNLEASYLLTSRLSGLSLLNFLR